jgi:hypothetical protein
MTTKQGTATPTTGSHVCNCQTGLPVQCTARTRKSFAQGHDARMASRLATAVAEGAMDAEKAVELIRRAGGSELLIGKMVRSAQLRKNGQGQPKKAKAEKAEKAAEPEAAPTEPGPQVNQEVPVKHGARAFKAVVVRNASQQLVARHRLTGQNCDHDVATGEKVN